MTAGKFKAFLFKLVTIVIIGPLYFAVISEGLRLLVPVLGQRLYKAIPGLSFLKNFDETYRIDLAHVLALVLFFAVYYLWSIILKILFDSRDFFAQLRFQPEIFTKFVFGLGFIVLGADAVLFYYAMANFQSGLFASSGFSLSAAITTLAYIAVLIFVSFVSVTLQKS